MSSIAKEEDNPFGKEGDKNIISCTDDIKNLQITCTDEEVDVCACCGKEGSDLNICNKCKDAKYCNAACKKKHRSKHKKKCERRVAELHDLELFKRPPQKEDCPICMLPLPSVSMGSKYYPCCGKTVCSGCIYAPIYDNLGNEVDNTKCPFCRTPNHTSNEEATERLKKRVEAGDAHAMFSIGLFYSEGMYGLTQDRAKALELWQQAGELGHADANFIIGNAYYNGRGVERDYTKADHYYELAAMRGNVSARFNLGNSEFCAGNLDRALKHYMVAAGNGHNRSVKNIRQLYMNGHLQKKTTQKLCELLNLT